MSKTFTYILIFFIFLSSCSDSLTEKEDKKTPEHIIQLSSSAELSGDVDTRAVSDFPNNGSIGIVAATDYSHSGQNPYWTVYPDISNAQAVASSENNNVYSFTWSNTKYWPFDGSNLYFMAYSPYNDGNNIHYQLSTDNTHLNMQLDPNLPDIMYASNNLAPVAYNKSSGVVQLGEFKHVLSKLTVEVSAIEGMSESIVVNNLSVSTNLRSASFPLYGQDYNLTVHSAQLPYVHTLISGDVHFSTQSVSNSMYLFPGTQDDVEISITLLDTSNGANYTANFMVSFFTNSTNETMELRRAENTLLTIFVRNIGVENPDRNIQLQGSVTDWNFQGNFGIAIN